MAEAFERQAIGVFELDSYLSCFVALDAAAKAANVKIQGIERNRLRTGIGLIEFERTKERLLDKLPKPPAVIYDIGGGYGEYSWWLSSLGHEVHLFDLSETNIEMSEELADEYPDVCLKAAEVCDARSIPRTDKSADAILFMGPLYSITEYEERILAIKECYRLLKDEGGTIVRWFCNRYGSRSNGRSVACSQSQ